MKFHVEQGVQLVLRFLRSCTDRGTDPLPPYMQARQLAFRSSELKCQLCTIQWRSQNAEKVTHIKRSLLDQAVILFNCVPFQNGNFS